MGRWRALLTVSHTLLALKSIKTPDFGINPCRKSLTAPLLSEPRYSLLSFRLFTALPSPSACDAEEDDVKIGYLSEDHGPKEESLENEEGVKIPVKAFFLCTSIDLKNLQAENSGYVIPQTGRLSNSLVLRFCDSPPLQNGGLVEGSVSCYRYMLVFQYGSAVLFNIQDHEVDFYLQTVKRHGAGLLSDIRKDDYAIKEAPLLSEGIKGGPDYIIVKTLDMDSIRIIGYVLSQSIALDHFVSQVDGMVEEFAEINRGMEKTGTFTMSRKKLFQLFGKANANIADVILKVRVFERSEIVWKDARYAGLLDYLREEYEVSQRIEDLNVKLRYVEHNIHFLQEVLQNRKSDLLEWCIIVLLAMENIIALYELVTESAG